jgi:hypothetical protein
MHPEVEVAEDIWTIKWVSEGIRFVRTLTLSATGFGASTRCTGNVRMYVSPWVTMRKSELYVQDHAGSVVGGVHVRGIWPADFTDFEGFAPFLEREVCRSVWQDQDIALSSSWSSDALARLEGKHLPQLIGSPGAVVDYRIGVGPDQERCGSRMLDGMPSAGPRPRAD